MIIHLEDLNVALETYEDYSHDLTYGGVHCSIFYMETAQEYRPKSEERQPI